MHSYHNVAELRQFRGVRRGRTARFQVINGFQPGRRLAPTPIDLNVEIPDLLPQRVAVQAQEIGGANLIAARNDE